MNHPRDESLNRTISYTLRSGTMLAAAIIALGMLSGALTARTTTPIAPIGRFDPSITPDNFPGNLVRGVADLEPTALVMLGVCLLLATPLLRVLACGLQFIVQRDLLYAIIAAIIAITLSLGLAGVLG